ncbi:hypothetical protein Tco_0059717 [Tanacetum coccineum]
MNTNFNNDNEPWELSLDIDDSDLHLTPIIPAPVCTVQPATPIGYCPNPVRIIPGPAGIVQQAKLLKEKVFILDSDGALMSTQEYMQKLVEDVVEDDDFNSGAWVVANCQVMFSDCVCRSRTVNMKDLFGYLPGIVHQQRHVVKVVMERILLWECFELG